MTLNMIDAYYKEGLKSEINPYNLDMNPFIGLVTIAAVPVLAVGALLMWFAF
ncbi:hypothetical protein ACQZV8_16405 [Magnetococcales bacterium HHB-1]